MSKDKIKSIYISLSIIIFFSVLTCLLVLLFVKNGILIPNADIGFHFSRVEEIFSNLKSGVGITYIATQTFSNTGTGSFLFYPTVFLYPWALFRFVLAPVTAYYVWFGTMMFLTMLISYFSMLFYSESRLRAVIFALIYSIAPYHLFLGLINFTLGEFIAYTFVPLVFLGLQQTLLGKEKWYLLSLGWVLLLYSHIVTTYIVSLMIIILSILYLLARPRQLKTAFVNLVKNGIIAMLLSIGIIVPFITDYIGGNVASPGKSFMFLETMPQLIISSVNNSVYDNKSIGIFSLVAIFFGWYFVKNSKLSEKVSYVLGIIFVIMTTTIFPWESLKNTIFLSILGLIQFPYRLNTYSIFFLSVTFSLIFIKNISKVKNWNKYLLSFSMIIFVCVIYWGTSHALYTKTNTSMNDNGTAIEELKNNKKNLAIIPGNIKVDNHSYNNMFDYIMIYGVADYYPENSFENGITPTATDLLKDQKVNSILSHKIIIDGKKSIGIPKVSPNKITYDVILKEDNTINLPVVAYNRTKVFINDHSVSHTVSSRGTVQVHGKKGENKIMVTYNPNKIMFLGILIAIVTWLIIPITLLVKKIRTK